MHKRKAVMHLCMGRSRHHIFSLPLAFYTLTIFLGSVTSLGEDPGISVKGIASADATQAELAAGQEIIQERLQNQGKTESVAQISTAVKASTSGRVHRGRPRPLFLRPSEIQLATSTKRVEDFEVALSGKANYTEFVKYFRLTGLNDFVANLLPFFDLTVLVPQNEAFTSLTAMQWVDMNSRRNGTLQVLAFHVLTEAFTAKELNELVPGTQFATADYPARGIVVYKLDTPKPSFGGTADATSGCSIVDESVFEDTNGVHSLFVHGVDTVMWPGKFFKA